MAEDFKISGAETFLGLSKALKAADRMELRKELHRGMRKAVDAHKPTANAELARFLPSGLAGKGRRLKQAIQVRTGADPGVRVAVRYGNAGRGLGASNARRLNNQGVIRHPVFADTEDQTRKEWAWVDQRIVGSKGWFDKVWRDASPEVRDQLLKVMERVADKIISDAKN